MLSGVGGTAWSFLAAFAAATLFILLILRTARGPKFFGVVFALAIFTGIGTLTASLFGPGAAIVCTSLAVLLYYTNRSVAIYDILILLGCAGVAAQLSSGLRATAVAVILAVLAIYDIAAVYVTRHMVVMAESLLRQKVFFAIILPVRPSLLATRISDVAADARFTFLGTGDLVLPALLVGAAARESLAAALCVMLGTLAGLGVLHGLFASQRFRRAMPALPPIAGGAVIGYLLSLLIIA